MSIRTAIVKATAALTLSAAAVGIVTISPATATTPRGQTNIAVAGDPSQWGRSHNEASVERKVNEYEGQQHKLVNEYEGQKVNEYEGQHR